MRVAGVKTLEQANEYLTNDYLAWWERELTVQAANPDDAHRRLDQSHNLAASLSHVEAHQVRSDYTLQWDGKFHRIKREAIVSGLRGANVRVEARLDGSLAVRHRERYLPIEECDAPSKSKDVRPVACGSKRIPGLSQQRQHQFRRRPDADLLAGRWRAQLHLFRAFARPVLLCSYRGRGQRRQ